MPINLGLLYWESCLFKPNSTGLNSGVFLLQELDNVFLCIAGDNYIINLKTINLNTINLNNSI